MTKKLVVLAAPFDYYKGGSEYQYKILEKQLSECFDISYLFRHPTKPREPHFVTYDYLFRKKYRDYLFTDAWAIYRRLRQLSPDVIYKRGINYITAIGIYYGKRNGCLSVLHIASQRDLDVSLWEDKEKYPIRQLLYSRIAEYAIRNADRVVCQSEDQRVLLERNFARQCDLVSPNIHPIPKATSRSKTDPLNVLWIGNIKPLKKPEKFLELANEFADQPQVRFVMIGREGLGVHFKNFIAKLNESKNVDYLGEVPVDEVNNSIWKCQILVNTSDYEGFPNTFIQAWMREVPVVSLNVDPDGLLANHHLGFHSGSLHQLKLDVSTLLGNQNMRNEIGQRARSIAEKKFGEDNANALVSALNCWSH